MPPNLLTSFSVHTLVHRLSSGMTCALGVVVLAGCATTSTPQGYGSNAQSTAAQAQQQMQQAEQSSPIDTAQTYLDLIVRMQRAGQWYASLAHTESFVQLYGAGTEIKLLRADALRNTGQTPEAQALYQTLLTAKERDTIAKAHRGLGLLHAAQGQYAQATEQLEQARQRNPIDPDVLGDLAYAHMLNGNLAAARLPAIQAAQLAPNNARVQLNLALFWLASGSDAQALALLQRLSAPQPKNAPALIDQNSIATLQTQLAAVRTAIQNRTAAVVLTSNKASVQATPSTTQSVQPLGSNTTTAIMATPATQQLRVLTPAPASLSQTDVDSFNR